MFQISGILLTALVNVCCDNQWLVIADTMIPHLTGAEHEAQSAMLALGTQVVAAGGRTNHDCEGGLGNKVSTLAYKAVARVETQGAA